MISSRQGGSSVATSPLTKQEWRRVDARVEQVQSPELTRPIDVPGTWAYVSPLSVRPGATLSVHVSAEGAHEVAIQRLGRSALFTESASGAQQADEAVDLFRSRHSDGCRQAVRPGSYVGIDGDRVVDRPLSLGLWVRPWRLPVTDTFSFAWAGLIADYDFPGRCHYALILDYTGRVGLYAGDAGAFRHDRLLLTNISVGDRLGSWTHVAGVLGRTRAQVFVNGCEALRASLDRDVVTPGTTRLRLGACAQNGVADNLLDADIAQPFLASCALDARDLGKIVADRGRTELTELGVEPLTSYWPLSEEHGGLIADAVGERHGWIANHGTWQVGGPGCSPDAGQPGYQPRRDPERGHGLRLASDDLVDCAWPPSLTVEVPTDAASGMYVAKIQVEGTKEQDALAVPFVVVRPRPRQRGSVALLVPTFTWGAYGRVPLDEVQVPGLTSSFYTTHSNGRLFFHVGLKLPLPRVKPYLPNTHRPAHLLHAHLVRPERLAETWLSREGYSFELVSDNELHNHEVALEDFSALMIVGHSEYWTDEMRAALDRYLEGGGNVLCLSGNTMYWRVSFDPANAVLEARKTMLEDEAHENPSWLRPSEWRERWHSDGRPGGTWTLVGEPASDLLGLESWGISDMGNPGGYSAYRVLEPDHPLMHEPERVPVTPRMTIGDRSLNGTAASGFETDAVLPGPSDRHDGVVVLARAEDQQNMFVVGRLPDGSEWERDADLGADLIYWDRPGGGRVINAGSIAFTGALPVDEGAAVFLRNALAAFGVAKDEHESSARFSAAEESA
jgi:hypothetical protein